MGRVHLEWHTNTKIVRRSCYRSDGTAKVRWPNPTSARFVADLSNWRAINGRPGRAGKVPRGHVEAYFCGLCKGWHVGHPPIPEWHHTCPQRREDLIGELGMRAVAITWRENSKRIRTEAGDTAERRYRRVRRPTAARSRAAWRACA